jgi:post-segregation antitoxin (ccd killing protein)
MTKQELTTLLRSVGVNENTITAMENAYDMGVEHERAWIIEANKEPIRQVNAYLQGDEVGLWLGKESEAKDKA